MRDIEKLRTSEPHRVALTNYSSELVTEGTSEAALLHAIVEAGLRAIREKVEAQGYAQMADDYDRRAVSRRRSPSWADDE